jgi:hypothetical protein
VTTSVSSARLDMAAEAGAHRGEHLVGDVAALA